MAHPAATRLVARRTPTCFPHPPPRKGTQQSRALPRPPPRIHPRRPPRTGRKPRTPCPALSLDAGFPGMAGHSSQGRPECEDKLRHDPLRVTREPAHDSPTAERGGVSPARSPVGVVSGRTGAGRYTPRNRPSVAHFSGARVTARRVVTPAWDSASTRAVRYPALLTSTMKRPAGRNRRSTTPLSSVRYRRWLRV